MIFNEGGQEGGWSPRAGFKEWGLWMGPFQKHNMIRALLIRYKIKLSCPCYICGVIVVLLLHLNVC